jgi:autotransporter passenger strand-loop-strand repeat protein
LNGSSSEQIVSAGGSATGTIIGQNATIGISFGGLESVLSGGTSYNTTIYQSGVEIICVGGTDEGVQIFGGEQDVFGSATSATIHTGSQVVEVGASVNATTIVDGGYELVYGSASNTIVHAGYEKVQSGGFSDGVL